ncbi:MAG: DUF1573 domain-containing protein [Candidatus Egerieousia sp.]
MNTFRRNTAVLLCIIFIISAFSIDRAYAQTGHKVSLKFDKVTHNFGRISIDAGPQECEFSYTNISDKPVVINNILSSCGCSVPDWSKAPIMPGKSGKIKVTYMNDQGAYPFDKSLTVYVSSSAKPVLLRITGVVYEKGKSLAEMFPAKFGPLGMRSAVQNGGQIEQGLSKSNSENIVNLSSQKVSVKFDKVSAGLKISINPKVIEPGESATISYTIDTKANESWGRTRHSASFVCNGVEVPDKFVVESVILTPYTTLSKEEIDSSPQIYADRSTVDFGRTSVGKKVSVKFNLNNPGKKGLRIYKVDTNGTSMNVKCPGYVPAGNKFSIEVTVNPKVRNSEEVFTLTLITNSPERPLVNLFITGIVQ